MRRLWTTAAILLCLVSTWGVNDVSASPTRQNSALKPAVRQSDPCGYRYAAWPVIQQTQDFANQTEANDTGSDDVTTTRAHYLLFKLDWMAYDYASPKGWTQLTNAQTKVLIAAISGASLSGPEFAMWSAINSICSWKGKAIISVGPLNGFGNQTADTKYFHVSNNWHVFYTFSCGDSPDSFMVVLYSAAGQQIDITVERTRKNASAGLVYKHGGAFYFKVITTCDWHVTAHS